MTSDSICVHCKAPIYFGVVVAGEWSHPYGNAYCQDSNGFTATPIRRATPIYHDADSVL